jgi:hypothetical protein
MFWVAMSDVLLHRGFETAIGFGTMAFTNPCFDKSFELGGMMRMNGIVGVLCWIGLEQSKVIF